MALGRGVGYTQEISSGGSGTVTSVGLSAPGIFSVSGSPVTVSGTLALSLVNQSANTVFAAPDGVGGTPTFRALTANDLPAGMVGWSLTGNAGTNPATNYVGTSDNQPVLISSFAIVGIRVYLNRVNMAGNDSNVNNSFGAFMIGGFSSVINASSNYSGTIGAVSSSITGALNMIIGAEGSVISGGTTNNNIIGSRIEINGNTGVVALGDYAGSLTAVGTDNILFARFLNGFRLNLTAAVTAFQINSSATMIYRNYYANSATPSLVLGAGAGAGSTFSIAGNNSCGIITINNGTGATAFGVLFTLTLSGGFAFPTLATMIIKGQSTAGVTFENNSTIATTASTIDVRNDVIPPVDGAVIQLFYQIQGY